MAQKTPALLGKYDSRNPAKLYEDKTNSLGKADFKKWPEEEDSGFMDQLKGIILS